MKQRLLFVIDSLRIGGAEKSMVTFLSVLDYKHFDVDLQLFGYGGPFEQFLPKEVKLLSPLPFTQFLRMPLWRQLLTFDLSKIWNHICYSLAIRKPNLRHIDRARLYWKFFSKYFHYTEKYHVAVAYAQDLPTLFVSDKANAIKKIAWINTFYSPYGINNKYYEPFYHKIDHIVTVSHFAKDTFLKAYPHFFNKISIIQDLLDSTTINRMAEEKSLIQLENDVPSILTIARLIKYTKGYDISMEASCLLKERGLKFRWYVIGKGPYREEMERYIADNQLQENFILLGAMTNPYPVLHQCTLYVQTSRNEGFGLSIAEARILNKPVVTTEFDAVYAQMVHGDNGLVVPQDPVAVADAIERMLNDAALYQHIVNYQKQEKKGNIEEIEKFYQLIDSKHEASAAI